MTASVRAHAGGALTLLGLRTGDDPAVGYTLLARRAQTWSARAVVRPPELVGGPPAGTDPDPRRAVELSRPEILEPLTEAGAWLQVEGPWRVLGVCRTRDPDVGALLLALGARIFPLIAEPDEFAGGLEWNI